MKVYIAGKITGDANARDKFWEAEKQLQANPDTVVLNPSVLPPFMQREDYMRICFAMIDTADIVMLLDDWMDSPGAKLEKAYCDYIGKPCMPFWRL